MAPHRNISIANSSAGELPSVKPDVTQDRHQMRLQLCHPVQRCNVPFDGCICRGIDGQQLRNFGPRWRNYGPV
jgi:hypothetical protein